MLQKEELLNIVKFYKHFDEIFKVARYNLTSIILSTNCVVMAEKYPSVTLMIEAILQRCKRIIEIFFCQQSFDQIKISD